MKLSRLLFARPFMVRILIISHRILLCDLIVGLIVGVASALPLKAVRRPVKQQRAGYWIGDRSESIC